jgi:hypothetical protein
MIHQATIDRCCNGTDFDPPLFQLPCRIVFNKFKSAEYGPELSDGNNECQADSIVTLKMVD